MARQKKKSGRRRRSRRGKKSKGYAKAKPLGASVGAGGSLLSMAVDPDARTGISPVTHLIGVFKGTDTLDSTVSSAREAAFTLSNYKWFAIGIAASASKTVPGLRLVARPVDSVVKSMTKGKWGL